VLAEARQKSDRQKRKESDRIHGVSCLKVLLDNVVSEPVTSLVFGVVGPLRPGANRNGTRKHDQYGVHGYVPPSEWRPNIWGHGCDGRRRMFETGRAGRYEQLRDMYRRRLSARAVPKAPGS